MRRSVPTCAVAPAMLIIALSISSKVTAAYMNPTFLSSRTRLHAQSASHLHLARYGPREELAGDMEADFWEAQEDWEKENEARVAAQRVEFQKLLEAVIKTADPDHLPGLMTRNVELLLGMRGYEGVGLLREAIEEAHASGDEERIRRVTAASDYILSFAEEFVEHAWRMDEANKALLGKIVTSLAGGWEGHGDRPGRTDEAMLDDLLERERENFTPGFLRHLEGECNRIASAPRVSPESAKLLQMMRLIQTRVLEELGKDLGEGAQVLGQLLGYEDKKERLAVLDGGLMVRGVEFAKELAALTKEALDEFPKVPGGADPGLVRIVEEIDERIKKYVDSSQSFQ